MEVNHFRPVFNVPQDSYHIQGFYHYVDANGPWASHAYDKKENSHLTLVEKKTKKPEVEIKEKYEQYRADEARAFVNDMSR
jgi:uncharacterized membrane protein YkgB